MISFLIDGKFWDLTTADELLFRDAIEQISTAGVSSAEKDARLLWSFTQGDPQQFDTLVRRRVAREPMSHLVGYRDFYKHRFLVSAAVLDPRPDTEILIEAALARPFQTVLDLGTGSGCILLSLLAEVEGAQGLGTDISQSALSIAAQNAVSLGVDNRARFIQSDWFNRIEGVFDLIVSNPPYIAQEEMAGLAPEVRDHEPSHALTDGSDGLSYYRTITSKFDMYLNAGGYLLVEIGPTQGAAVSQMLRAAGLINVEVLLDLDGRDRVVVGHKPHS